MKNTIRKIMGKTLDEYECFTPDIFLADGDSLIRYGFDAQILHLPGHTRGSIGILTSAGDFIAGDIFMANKKPEPAILAYDFGLLKESIDRAKKENIKTVFPGHGNPI